jgi:hypothetical protein
VRVRECVLPDGDKLEVGDLFTVKALNGKFRFKYVYTPDGSLAAWGPVDSQHAQARAFPLDRVKKKVKPKGVRRERV